MRLNEDVCDDFVCLLKATCHQSRFVREIAFNFLKTLNENFPQLLFG